MFGCNLFFLKLKIENWKQRSKIIFKCMNSTVDPWTVFEQCPLSPAQCSHVMLLFMCWKKKKKTPQMWVWKRRSKPTLNECLDRTYCVSAFSISRFLLLFFFGTCLGNNFHYYGYCSWTTATQFDFSAHQWVLCTIHGIHKPHF